MFSASPTDSRDNLDASFKAGSVWDDDGMSFDLVTESDDGAVDEDVRIGYPLVIFSSSLVAVCGSLG